MNSQCISAMATKRTSGRNNYPLKIAITEANLKAQTPGDYVIPDTDPESHLRGQWWCDFMGLCLEKGVSIMNFWSSAEGVPGAANNFGYMQSTGGGGKKRPNYHHFSMMANNFLSTTNNSSTFYKNNYTTNDPELKAFAYRNSNEIGVLLMNQHKTVAPLHGHNFNISFDNGTTAGVTANPFQIKLNMSVAKAYDCYIKTESTVLLKFDASDGSLISRTEYSIEEARNNVGPKTWTPPNTPDAYIADHPGDVGKQPNQEIVTQNGGISWASTDIWVRNSDEFETVNGNNRYPNEHDHMSPQWTGTQGNEPYVFVKVRNRGCSQITGNVLAYWGNASTGLTWNSMAANLVDPTNPTGPVLTLNAGEERVVKIQWKAMTSLPIPNPGANNTAHYCFVARWLSSNEPADGEDISNGLYSLGNNVFNFNNFAQKNVSLVGGAQRNPVLVGNPSGSTITHNLTFSEPLSQSSDPFTSHGYINVDLGPSVYQKWINGGSLGNGIVSGLAKHRHLSPDGTYHYHADEVAANNPYEIKIVSANASLNNLTFDANDMQQIKLQFGYSAPFAEQGKLFTVDLLQGLPGDQASGGGGPIGGERYLVSPPVCAAVNAGYDRTIGIFCSTQLDASPVDSEATYKWRDNTTGQLIGMGSSIVVFPTISTTYELEMKTTSGCVSYSTVVVNVSTAILPDPSGAGGPPPCLPGLGRLSAPQTTSEISEAVQSISFNAFPNPFSDNLTVTYSLPQDSKAGSLRIVEAASGKLVYVSELNSNKNKLDIKLNVAAGLYICHITADDGSSKQFKMVHIK